MTINETRFSCYEEVPGACAVAGTGPRAQAAHFGLVQLAEIFRPLELVRHILAQHDTEFADESLVILAQLADDLIDGIVNW